MAEIIELAKQFISIEGHSIDAATEPVDTYTGVTGVATRARYVGMEKVVINKGDGGSYPMKFFLSGSTRNAAWKIKEIFPVQTHEALDNLVTFTTGLGVPFAKFTIGLEVIVIADEQNEGKPTKYWITAVDATANTVTWERCNGSSSAVPSVTVEGEDMESMS